jgi:hypothetical protein
MPTKFPPPVPIVVEPDVPRQPSYAVRKRDEAVRRAVRAIRRAVPALQDERFTPLLRSYCTMTIWIERAHARLKDQDVISPMTGELRSSLDTLARLVRSQAAIARELCLTPGQVAQLAKPVTAVLDLEAYRSEDDEPGKESD